MRKNPRAALMAAAAATSLICARITQADVVWTGTGGDTSWSNAGNWSGTGSAPTSADNVTFSNSGEPNLANTLDAAAVGTIKKLTFNQDNSSADGTVNAYVMSIDRGMTLSPYIASTSNLPVDANASFLVKPATKATSSAATGTYVKIKSSTAGTGALGAINMVSTGGNMSFSLTGRPGVSGDTATANESFAVLDLTDLDSFTYSTAPSFAFSSFGIGAGNVSTNDQGAISGKLILGKTTTINVNRFTVGGQSNAAAAGNQANSMLVLGPTVNIGTGLSGNFNVGSAGDAQKDPSGVVLFRAGLTPADNPTLNIGNAQNNNGLQVGRHNGNTGHFCYGVIDTTSASGGSEGTFNAGFTSMQIGRGSSDSNNNGAGGAAGMVSFDKGTINATSIVLGAAATRASGLNANANIGQLNLGLKGSASDAGQGVLALVQATPGTPATITLGQRLSATTAAAQVNTGIINLANGASLSGDRVFLADNTQAAVGGSAVGILNLGGTLNTGQIHAGSDAAQNGTNSTRLVNFNGGTLKIKSISNNLGAPTYPYTASFMEGLTGAYVYSNGGTINTDGQDVTVNQALLAPTGNGVSSTVTITTPGFGYRGAPVVMVARDASDTTGTGATAVAQIDSTGAVTGITITNPGTDYTAPPVFQLIANAGTTYANMQIPFGTASTVVTAQTAVVTGTITPNTSGGITKVGPGTLTLTGSNTYTGATTVAAGALKVNTAAANALLTNAAGTDIKGGQVIFDYTTASDPVAYKNDIKSKLATAYASGFASGQIHSSTATPQIGLGYQDNSGSSAFTVQRAVYGDVNLDGMVAPDDFTALAQNFNKTGQSWTDGDFNYDGTVNALDFNALATNFGSSLPVAAPALGALVPEPATISLLGLAVLGVAGRRRRQA